MQLPRWGVEEMEYEIEREIGNKIGNKGIKEWELR